MSAPLSDLEIGLALAGLVASTWITRAGLLLIDERLKLGARVEAGLRYAPACALAALIAPDVLLRADALDLTLSNPRPYAALAATAFLLWRQDIVGCIVVGMSVIALMRWLAV